MWSSSHGGAQLQPLL
uniref:Uncharacterized protein n=1 Tax=Arundo donax TaxID=35708 RepID=A0A0A9DUF7_ARUDO